MDPFHPLWNEVNNHLATCGDSPHGQQHEIIYAIKKAIAQGIVKSGEPFPCVLTMSKRWYISRTMAYRITNTLARLELIALQPGGAAPLITASPRKLGDVHRHLVADLKKVVVEAKIYGADYGHLLQALHQAWDEA